MSIDLAQQEGEIKPLAPASAPAILRHRLTAVSTRRELAQFIDVPWTVFKGDPNWMPPLKLERRELLSPKSNPYFEHAKAQYFVATKDGAPVGRISAQTCELVQQRMGQGTGQFGFFDCVQDAAISSDLFHAAEDWLRGQNMTRVMGPFNLSINEEVGLLIDGWNTPHCFLMSHARPYYKDYVEAAGFQKAKDMYAYWLDITHGFPSEITKMVNWGLSNSRFNMRNIVKSRFDEEIRTVLDIFNDAWSDNWGYIPLTPAEIDKTAKDLKLLIRPETTRIIEYDGEAAAFMAALPDINRWTADLNGQLLPFGWVKLLYRLIEWRPNVMRVPLMGVRKKLQKTRSGGVMALMLIETIRAQSLKRGATCGELSWILEDNHGMREMLVAIGCQIYKTYRVYEKPL